MLRTRVVGSGQYGFTKGKLCLTNLTACYDEMTEEKAMGESHSSHLWIFTCLMSVPKSSCSNLSFYEIDFP